MLKQERQQLILEILQQNGKVLASELSSRLGVSEDTVRRDLRELADAGRMQRVHGGALPHSPAEAGYVERLYQSPQAKASIAAAAVRLFEDGQVIILDGGTTALQVARHISLALRATIITNSPVIAATLAEYPSIEVIVLGGKLLKASQVTIGAAVVEMLHSLRADLCILGVCSLHPEIGVSVADLEEAYVKRAMLAHSVRTIALASAEKLGTASTYIVSPVTALTTLITEKSIPESILDPYRLAGIEVIQA